MELETLVSKAQNGDKDALEGVVQAIQDDVHHLAMRMLVNPDDALDAVQDILILVITKLSTFSGRSAFKTWVYRVSFNYLLNAKKSLARDPGLSFDGFEQDLADGLGEKRIEDPVLLNELRVSCTMAMLLCLDRAHRAAYIVGFILEIAHDEAAEILAISKTNYRQRLSRARQKVNAFTQRACGLVNSGAACSCPRRLPAAMAVGRIQEGQTFFGGGDAAAYAAVLRRTKRLESGLRTLTLQQATRRFASPRDFAAVIGELVDTP
ncbi:RNA polymerase sigma factor [Acanthopleuribacter pedis]|uniref:RNA polymerase sigma factor n=1 Tax=Acanthopleuribacter pedis TaxID=442870 RepID=A0A8J7U8S2_9BACT|nr:RNA polymerase sigma factor [Acanthopleuribacter pedis]MBO1322881.1 RNA polymerase sigma factor [Acanthopleuribacter pedis]